MNLPEHWQQIRALARASSNVLRQHPRLVWFPMVAMGTNLALVLALVLFFACIAWDASPYRAGFVATLGMTFLFEVNRVVSEIALSHAAMEALAGRPWSVRAAYEHAQGRAPAVASHAAFLAGATMLLGRVLRRRGRRTWIGPRVLALAWSSVTYLVIPVLTREPCRGWRAITRSRELFHQVWPAVLLGKATAAAAWLVLLPLLIGAALALSRANHEPMLWFAAAVLGAAFFVGIWVISTFATIYRCAVYIFACEGVVPEPYNDPALATIWQVRGESSE